MEDGDLNILLPLKYHWLVVKVAQTMNLATSLWSNVEIKSKVISWQSWRTDRYSPVRWAKENPWIISGAIRGVYFYICVELPRDLNAREQNCVKSGHSDRPRRRNLRPTEGPASIGLSGEIQGWDWSLPGHVTRQRSVWSVIWSVQRTVSVYLQILTGEDALHSPSAWGSWTWRRGRGRPSIRYYIITNTNNVKSKVRAELNCALIIINICSGGRRRGWSQGETSEDQFRIKVGHLSSALW